MCGYVDLAVMSLLRVEKEPFFPVSGGGGFSEECEILNTRTD